MSMSAQHLRAGSSSSRARKAPSNSRSAKQRERIGARRSVGRNAECAQPLAKHVVPHVACVSRRNAATRIGKRAQRHAAQRLERRIVARRDTDALHDVALALQPLDVERRDRIAHRLGARVVDAMSLGAVG